MGTPKYSNAVWIGYARTSTRLQDHQLQLDALAAADCREVIVETAGTRGDRPETTRHPDHPQTWRHPGHL